MYSPSEKYCPTSTRYHFPLVNPFFKTETITNFIKNKCMIHTIWVMRVSWWDLTVTFSINYDEFHFRWLLSRYTFHDSSQACQCKICNHFNLTPSIISSLLMFIRSSVTGWITCIYQFGKTPNWLRLILAFKAYYMPYGHSFIYEPMGPSNSLILIAMK